MTSPDGLEDLRQMIQIVYMHYRDRLSQAQIAEQLKINASKVSRIISRATENGYVRITYNFPDAPALSIALMEKFHLRDAVVIPASKEEPDSLKRRLGAAGAAYFEKHARPGDSVGMSCGYTLFYFTENLREQRFKDLKIYPLSAEIGLRYVDVVPSTLCGLMAAKYRPSVEAYSLHSSALQSRDQSTVDDKWTNAIGRIVEGARNVNFAMVSIGALSSVADDQIPGFGELGNYFGLAESDLRAMGAVGEINYQPFDKNGQEIINDRLVEYYKRVLCVDIPRLRALAKDKYVVAIAGGLPKVDAIRGALAGRCLSVLITDSDVAQQLLLS